MLFLTFQIGGAPYALDCANVAEIVPMVRLRQIPNAPRFVRGVFQYRGQVVPVIDLCSLAGFDNAREVLSTRIIIVCLKDSEGRDRVLGLVAEQVMETVRAEKSALIESGIAVETSPYLGKMLTCPQGLVQCIRPEALVSASLGHVLFPVEQ